MPSSLSVYHLSMCQSLAMRADKLTAVCGLSHLVVHNQTHNTQFYYHCGGFFFSTAHRVNLIWTQIAMHASEGEVVFFFHFSFIYSSANEAHAVCVRVKLIHCTVENVTRNLPSIYLYSTDVVLVSSYLFWLCVETFASSTIFITSRQYHLLHVHQMGDSIYCLACMNVSVCMQIDWVCSSKSKC